MQAIIMAAGRGSRLGNLTDTIPKAFLTAKEHRLIDYNLSLLHENGIDDIKIVTGYKAGLYEDLAKEHAGITCIYNPFYAHCNVLGSFYMAQNELRDEDTVYLHADTLCDPAIFEEMVQGTGDIVMPVDFKTCDKEAMKVITEAGQVVKVSKEIPEMEAEGEFIGMAKLSAKAMPAIKAATRKLMREGCLNSYFEGAIQAVIDEGGYRVPTLSTEKRFWGEVDFEEDYRYVKDNLPDALWQIAERHKND
ncbi:phosphocholine cytidylyltransferase family protein [Selenomonas caprae]|uniref:Phosphocholine cytidylyltransferase family protein n=1 Tax=Selenomonas caprae TaxID=2606905 RepID=A0A5D6WM53_9FIRM|nr:phosphocholine cytidylyltransferase family protein [Selenomonas caprae]TYZ28967.1 phosphocholine cytidylyltransferase family protein [Selenomonas caprae]